MEAHAQLGKGKGLGEGGAIRAVFTLKSKGDVLSKVLGVNSI